MTELYQNSLNFISSSLQSLTNLISHLSLFFCKKYSSRLCFEAKHIQLFIISAYSQVNQLFMLLQMVWHLSVHNAVELYTKLDMNALLQYVIELFSQMITEDALAFHFVSLQHLNFMVRQKTSLAKEDMTKYARDVDSPFMLA